MLEDNFQVISFNDIYIYIAFNQQRIIMLILATDMARHSEILEKFKSQIKAGFNFKDTEHLTYVSKHVNYTQRKEQCLGSGKTKERDGRKEGRLGSSRHG